MSRAGGELPDMVSWNVSPRDRMVVEGVEFEVVGESERYDRSPFGSIEKFPTPFTVGHRAHSMSGRDSHGNPVSSWSAPIPREVHGWAAPSSLEPKLSGHDRVVVDIELFAPEWRVINLRRVSG